jgi:hypothetical protein
MSEASKQVISQWLTAAPMVRGTLVRGVRFPDQTFVTDVDARDFPAGALEQAWRLVSDTFDVLTAQRLPPQRLTWVYDRTVLHCVQHPGGAILGVCVSRKSAEGESDDLNRLLTEFRTIGVENAGPPSA